MGESDAEEKGRLVRERIIQCTTVASLNHSVDIKTKILPIRNIDSDITVLHREVMYLGKKPRWEQTRALDISCVADTAPHTRSSTGQAKRGNQ